MKYIKQFDTLRAIAVLLVIVSHWLPKFKAILPLGKIGVDIFFVLSGFLISSILFENKKMLIEHELSRGSIIKNFIIRRTLRIFPIYYLMITVHYLVSEDTGTHVRENAVYYYTYTTNILYFIQSHMDGIASHFWSLAAEEQFYLFWPWIILFFNDKYLVKVMWLFVIIGIIVLLFVPFSEMLTPACFTSFALGAILANVISKSKDIAPETNTVGSFRIINYFAILSIVLLALFPFFGKTINQFFPVRLATSLVTLWAIKYSLFENDKIVLNMFLNNSILIFMGKISYGVYIYHTLIPWAWKKIILAMQEHGFDFYSLYYKIPKFLHNDLDLVFKFGFLILVAWLSWILIEKPINSLKKYFEYQRV